jgi:hypothetical protein
VHRRFGKIYFWAMAGVAVTALILSVALPVYFLTMVAVFSFYSAFAAYRVLYLKGMYKGARPKAVDWMAAVVTVLSSLLLFLMGFLRPELMHVGVVLVQRAPGPGKLPRIPFSRKFCSEPVATMPAVHAPKLKPTIAPRRMRPLPF